MLSYEIFDLTFPYLTNGGLYQANVLAEKKSHALLFHIYPLNRVDFNSFDLLYDENGVWKTSSDYIKQKEFYESVCLALKDYLGQDLLFKPEAYLH